MCLGCIRRGHKYEIIDRVQIWEDSEATRPYGMLYIQRCKKCGKIKKKKVTSEF